MNKHSNTYEQYCGVLDKNIVIEELVYHNGKKARKCTSAAACGEVAGCRFPSVKIS